MRYSEPFVRWVLLGALLAPVFDTPHAAAQSPDFLFRRPRVSLGIRGGYSMPRAGSEIFEFTRDQLTVEKSDFNAGAFTLELALRATERVDVAFDVGFSRSEIRSEFRDWTGDDDLPIEQATTFQLVPTTITVKGYLLDRGRSVSRFAWVPGKWSPYVGVGGGWLNYKFEQDGEWVDFETLEIFRESYLSEGTTATGHVLAGAEFSLGPRFVLVSEGRYSWASKEMDIFRFDGFDKIDLAGFRVTAGVSVRF